MENEINQLLLDRFDARISSLERKRSTLGKNLGISKFLRILFGVSSISLVSLSAFSEFSDELRFIFTLSALSTTTIATFSDELLAAFGFRERYAQNVKVLGQLQNLKAEMELDIVMLSPAPNTNAIDYWKYHRKLNEILNNGHSDWNTMMTRTSK